MKLSIREITKSEFIKSVAILMTGTMVAQVFGYLFAPVLTRIYTPEEMGELGVFLRVVAVGGAIATLKYENAIPIIKRDVDAFRMYRYVIGWITKVALLSGVLLIIPFFGVFTWDNFLYYAAMPLSILIVGYGNLGTTWAIRKKQFKHISYFKSSGAIGSNILKILFGFMGLGYIGLILGHLLGTLITNYWFAKDYLKNIKLFTIPKRSKRNLVLARKYDRFPKINLPHVMMDLGRDLLLALIISQIFTKFEFGSYDHSYKMLRMPLVFVGVALGQVFFQKCAERVNNRENIQGLLLKAVKTLVMIAIVPFTIIFFFGEELFSFVFGENWATAGKYSEIMAPWLMMNFITSPFSTIPMVINRQKEFFWFGFMSSCTLILGFLVPYYIFECNMLQLLQILSVTQSLVLLFINFKILQYSGRISEDAVNN